MPDESTQVDAIGLVVEIGRNLALLETAMDDAPTDIKAVVFHRLVQPAKTLRWISSEMSKQVGEAMKMDGLKTATVSHNGEQLTVTASNSPKRSEVDRDALVAATERAVSADPRHTVNSVTGEVIPLEQARLGLIKTCFRFEPRWGELRKIGLDADEFCRTEWVSTIKVDVGGTL
jgi:hypothetical protein|tara:strand:- start:1848 stop:2372 length:525 start_codon:yes stop_codon:yes gene_type:complete